MKKLTALMLLIPLLTFSAPRPAFQSLMDEPANLLDIVMLRLGGFIQWTGKNMGAEFHVAAKTDRQRPINLNAAYVPDKGHILVSASLMDLEGYQPEQMKAGCDQVITMMRINLYKGLPGLFIHIDGSFPPNSEGLQANMADLIQLSCVVYGTSTTEVKYHSTSPLAVDGMKVYFRDNE